MSMIVVLLVLTCNLCTSAWSSPCQDSNNIPFITSNSQVNTVSLPPNDVYLFHFVPPATGQYYLASPSKYVLIEVLQGMNCDYPLNIYASSNTDNAHFSGFDFIKMVEGELYTIRVSGSGTVQEIHMGTDFYYFVARMAWMREGLITFIMCLVFAVVAMCLFATDPFFFDDNGGFEDDDEATCELKQWTIVSLSLCNVIAGTVWALPLCFPLSLVIVCLVFYAIAFGDGDETTQHVLFIVCISINTITAVWSLGALVDENTMVECNTTACLVQVWSSTLVGEIFIFAQCLLIPSHILQQDTYWDLAQRYKPSHSQPLLLNDKAALLA